MIPITSVNDWASIRCFRPEDSSFLFEAVQESLDDLCRSMAWCHPDYSLEDSRAFVAHCRSAWDQGEQYNFAIVDSRDDTFIGSIGLNRVDRLHRSANVGYWVRRSCMGQGIATEATRAVADCAFKHLRFQRLELLISCQNPASRRVAEKAGAKFEGILRKRLNLGAGSQDAWLYSLLAEDVAPATRPALAPVAA